MSDFWSEDIPGRIVKVKLTSDGSYIEWGFRVDEIWPSTNEPIPEAFISGVYITLLNPGTVFLDNTEMF